MLAKNTQNSRSKFRESLIGAAAGTGIGEMARQLVQYDHAAWWRVLMLIVIAIALGCVIGRTCFRPAKEAGEPSDSGHDRILRESYSE